MKSNIYKLVWALAKQRLFGPSVFAQDPHPMLAKGIVYKKNLNKNSRVP
jgi:hypothetical protein